MYPKALRSVPLIILFILICFGAGGTQEQTRRIPGDEMAALRDIAQQLGKTGWNLSLNKCDENGNWYTPENDGVYNSTVKCTCLGDVCHISAIYLTGQDLPGVLPKSIANLSSLTIIDLSRNFLNGSIPLEWTSTKLEYLYLSMNRLSGTIPKYLGSITSLTNLSLEGNMFEGTIPAELGKLAKLQYFNLNSNNLTGELPKELLNNLINLREVRLSSNSFTGKLPSFQSWEQLQKLELEASGFEGPIPSSISHLRNLTELRITDLNGGGASNFPPLDGMREMKRLMLRSCNISGSIPDYIGNLPALTELDLTYNRLEGNITNLEATGRLQRTYLTGNLLTGPIPRGITSRDSRYQIDLSYNNFSEFVDEAPPCKDTLNLFRSFSNGKNSDFAECLKETPCRENFKPPSNQTKTILTITGAIASALCLTLAILFIVWWKTHPGSSSSREHDLRGLDLQTGLFTYRQIKAATNDFDINNKIGEGGFGSVYKGILLDGSVIAVKQLSSKSKQGNREFVNEIGMISGLQHPNLVRLYGCCVERNQLLLVYEYMENNSLARALFGECQLNLDWPTRLRICIGIARGLAFLHEESRLKIVHRDIKATNVLLDGDLDPKISDFGLAKLSEDDNTHISTRIAGTIGYMAPEYALWGYLTNKADVYSFGVVALEIVAGRDNMKYRPNENYVCLLDWALVLRQQGCLMDLVDPKLGSDFNKEEAMRMTKVALLCTNPSPALRPTMSAVVSMLEGKLGIEELVNDPRIYGDDFRFVALRDKYDELLRQTSTEAETLMDHTVTGSSSTSAQDLYPRDLYSL